MKVLLAEDDAISRRMLEAFLVKWGYEVVVTMGGEDSWAVLQAKDAPRLAILDWVMPGKDGIDICRKIRQRKGRPYTYIILVTARGQKEDIVEGLEAGADDYIIKPFDPYEFRARLRAGVSWNSRSNSFERVRLYAIRRAVIPSPKFGIMGPSLPSCGRRWHALRVPKGQ